MVTTRVEANRVASSGVLLATALGTATGVVTGTDTTLARAEGIVAMGATAPEVDEPVVGVLEAAWATLAMLLATHRAVPKPKNAGNKCARRERKEKEVDLVGEVEDIGFASGSAIWGRFIRSSGLQEIASSLAETGFLPVAGARMLPLGRAIGTKPSALCFALNYSQF